MKTRTPRLFGMAAFAATVIGLALSARADVILPDPDYHWAFTNGANGTNSAPRRFEWVICLKRAAYGGRYEQGPHCRPLYIPTRGNKLSLYGSERSLYAGLGTYQRMASG